MNITSKNLAVPKSKKIVIERRFLNHRANDYYYGSFGIGDDNASFGISYYYTKHEKLYGTKINHKDGRTDLCGAEFDKWITEKVIVDFAAGTMSYYIDNKFIATKTVPGLSSMNATYYHIGYNSYGWWTGHYSNIDYIKIKEMK